MRSSAAALLVLAGLGAPAAAEAPLSAIDWLSDTVREAPLVTGPAPGPGPDFEEITITPLGEISKDATGLVPAEAAGLPRDLWARSSPEALAGLIARQRADALPALLDLLYRLMLVEADPPAGDGAEPVLLLARLDKLLDLGALDQAQALLERAGPNEPEIFRRWFDVSLLVGHEDYACAAMRATPDIAPTLPARVFCLARGGDWNAAVLTLATGETLGHIPKAEADLLAWFLDPELFEGQPDLPPPPRLTPLVFRMREAVAQPRPAGALPLAFAHADLSDHAGWKAQLDAAERLARSHAIPPAQLVALYTERAPAASGGVWDRVAAIQAFDIALLAGDPAAVARSLPDAWAAMHSAGLEVPFAEFYGERLLRQPLGGEAGRLAFRVALLSPAYEAAAAAARPADAADRFLQGVARGDLAGLAPPSTLAAAIADGFAAAGAPGDLGAVLGEGRLGEAVLRAMLRVSDGAHADPGDVTAALALFRQVGLEDTARRVALQLLLLDRRG